MRLWIGLIAIGIGLSFQSDIWYMLLYGYESDRKIMTLIVKSELTQYVNDVGIPTLEFVRGNAAGYENQFRSGEITSPLAVSCYHSLEGRFADVGCGIEFANVLGSLLEDHYKTTQEYERQRSPYSLKSFREIMDLSLTWRGDSVKPGQSIATIVINGISGRLMKCALRNSHHILVFVSDKTEPIIIDAAYRQFLVEPKFIHPPTSSILGRVFENTNKVFVGTSADVRTVFTMNQLINSMSIIANEFRDVVDSTWANRVSRFHDFRLKMFDEYSVADACG